MPIDRLFVVLNPAANKGRTARLEAPLRDALRAMGLEHRLVLTGGLGDATDLAMQAAREGWPAVAAVGGDGTINEVANGLLRAGGDGPVAILAGIAAGSGNDFLKMLGPIEDPREAVQRIIGGTPRMIDVGVITHCTAGSGGPRLPRYFINGVGLGFDAQIASEARRVRRLKGLAIYVAALFRSLRRLHAPRVRIEIDDELVVNRRVLLTTLANGGCYGGGFWLCPEARIDDGLLDVLVVDRCGVGEAVAVLWRALRGRHLAFDGVRVHRGTTARLQADEPMAIHVDGEIIAEDVREVSIRLLPKRLPVLA